jgi:TetR/AcrR family transcriptional regulator, cholesterol catabolism regulator
MLNERKDEILDKAVQLFLKKGYEKTTLRDIGKSVGIQAPGLYHYFKGKKAILYQIEHDGWQRFKEMVVDPVEKVSDPEEKIRLYICNMIRFQLALGERNLMVDNSVAVKGVKGRKGRDRKVFDLLRDTICEMATARGLKNSVNPTLAAFTLYSMVSHVHGWYKPNGELSVEELIEEITRLFFFGFNGGKSMSQLNEIV